MKKLQQAREVYLIDDFFDTTTRLVQTASRHPLGINQTWFKLLALVAFTCALFVCASLVWLLVCRASRLPITDSQIKHEAVCMQLARKRRRSCWRRRQQSFRRRLRYLVFGKMRIHSPPSFSHSSSESESNSSRNFLEQNEMKNTKVNTVKETNKKTNKK
jgi:hypothetical protein